MRGLKKAAPNGANTHRHTHGHGNSMTESAQWGRLSEKPMITKDKSLYQLEGLKGTRVMEQYILIQLSDMK